MIPAEAVEAAALSIHRAHPFQSLSICRAVARAALEAAAPYIMAAAWDEGAAWTNDAGAYTYDENPYRSKK